MTDPLTAAELDAIEQRLNTPRLGRSIARERDLDLLAIRQLLAEVRRLQAADERVRALHRPVDIEPSDTICGECSYGLRNGRYLPPVVEYPCPTIAALDGGE